MTILGFISLVNIHTDLEFNSAEIFTRYPNLSWQYYSNLNGRQVMSEKTASKSKSWRIYYQDSFEYYESQQAALAALDSIIASYDNGIWSDRDSYLTLSYEQGVAVDNDLFDSSYSTNSLILNSSDRRFKIDIYIKNKEDSSTVLIYFSSQSSLVMNVILDI
jgi:hypothetical protein